MNSGKREEQTLAEEILHKSLEDVRNITDPVERSKKLDECNKLASMIIDLETLEETRLKNYVEREQIDVNTRKTEIESKKYLTEIRNGTIKTYAEIGVAIFSAVTGFVLGGAALFAGYKFEYEDAGIPMGKTFSNFSRDMISVITKKIGK